MEAREVRSTEMDAPIAQNSPAEEEEEQEQAADSEAGRAVVEHAPEKYRVYPGRFYVLIAFALLAGQQALSWMTFGTIPNEAYKHFGLTDDDVTLLSSYEPIVFLPVTLVYMWFLDRFGLRISVLLSAWIMAFGMGIRCLVPDNSKWVFLIHVGHVLIGIVGPPLLISPPRLSSIWFSPKHRTWATAVPVIARSVGIALAFITIPYLTRHYDIHTMLYVQTETAICVALLATIYFPNTPPTPPSQSAGMERTKFFSSLKQLIRNRSFILLVISGGLVAGGNAGLSSVLNIIVNRSLGFHNRIAVSSLSEFFHSNAWMGALTSVSGALGGQVMGLIADKTEKRFKVILLLLVTMSTALAFWFAASVYGYTSNNAVNLFLTLCFQYFFALSTTSIFLEAAVEVTYPIPEGSSAGVLMILSNMAILIFQVIGMSHIFSNSHPQKARVMVWVLAGLSTLAGVILLFFREEHRRLKVDKQETQGQIQGTTYGSIS